MIVWYVSAYDQPRGQSTRTYDFSRELVRRGHEVTMFCNGYCHFTHNERLRPNEAWRVEIIDGIRVVWLKTRPYEGNSVGRGLNMIDNARRVLQVSKEMGDRPDIVLGPSVPLLTAWAASRVADRYNVPFIFEVRDVWPEALVDIGGLKKNSLTYVFFRYIEKLMYRRAAAISSTLPNIHQHIAASGGDSTKVVYIPNGIDLSLYNDTGLYDGGNRQQLAVMYVGGFGLDHDVFTIIRAAKILQDVGDTRFHFVVIGGGALEERVKAEAHLYSLKNLVFKGVIPKTSLPAVQRDADILLAAITDSKSYRFGLNLNKLCSYFASGRPILFSGNPPNNPVADSGAGISVKAEDPQAMVDGLRMLAEKEPSERVRLGNCGRTFARTKFSMEVLGNRMEELLRSSINDHANHV
jgi:glycosyltransferase involved in cell wall biosynthesis